MNTFDYIVVGAGSAGCVLADRLTADGRHRVLLLEAGGDDDRFFVTMPIGYGKCFFDPAVNWMYRTEPEANLGGRRIYAPRGKVQGGSGSINAMIFVRGARQDFDDWREAGNPGWGFDDVLPYFRKLETHARGESPWHGANGPIHVTPMHCTPVVHRRIPRLGIPMSRCHQGQFGARPWPSAMRCAWKTSTARNSSLRRTRRSPPQAVALRNTSARR